MLMMNCDMFTQLKDLLQKRLEIIADHAWRDRDPVTHLTALSAVSQSILDWTASNHSKLDARLRHYLDSSSFQKALDHMESNSGKIVKN